MTRILHFTKGPEDWKALLASPEKHWKPRFSARTLAHSWEAADGLPPEVAKVFTETKEPLLQSYTPVLAIPEFKVALPGGRRASQNDIFVLGHSTAGAVSMVVEGKVNESFGPTVEEWLVDASPGKKKRLEYLVKTLGLGRLAKDSYHYQLFHRAACAVIEGERFRASAAVMLVHSFSVDRERWPDYEAFLGLFGVRTEVGKLQRLPGAQPVPLFAAWVTGDTKFLRA